MSPKNLLLVTILFVVSFITKSQTQVADYLNFNSGNGKGIRFWGGSDSYKISMGNSSDYKFGSVTDYSIKFTMNNSATRGWTWGVIGLTPVASLNTEGKLHLASDLTTLGRLGVGTNTPSALLNVLATGGTGIDDYFLRVGVNRTVYPQEAYDVLFVNSEGVLVGPTTSTPGSFINDPSNFRSSRLKVASSIAAFHRTQSQLHYIRIDASNGNAIVTDADATALYIKKDNNISQNLVIDKLFARELELKSGSTINFKVKENGYLYARQIEVQASGNFPDYVFHENYDLRSVEEVETFIKENRHLPDVPSAQEVEENGHNLGQMDEILLKKIEELTLYIIELKKQNDNLSERVKELEETISVD